ncbi:aldehyde ferredoxin oxidoreductase family protein [uncultured Thermanaerothrix sp.]|uniref:aldehyde ferredoxin oxidoreductase family protein n=1 Tax=uncultured Thermanaerothrix sp. TaxID=1195149 RepID=UPI002601E195|nr:aldehyde ferredoxin oxidoreductase family protein [uncultured Thermanaerothrix sp.]
MPFGRMLTVNLTQGTFAFSSLPRTYVEDFIGGSSLAARLIWETLAPQRDPLHPDNPLIFVTGPMTGTGGPTTGRFTICGRSPQTGLWGESNIGGFVGPELRQAGVDVLWITGRAAEPVYVYIRDGDVSLRPAGHLWGKADTYETQEILKTEVGDSRARVACIGLAGENEVPMAGILADHGRLAARTGLGALMGSKNLKALVVRGTGQIPLARPEEYRKLRVAANKNLLDQNLTAVLRATGTSGAAEYLQFLGDMPQRYWTAATFEGATNISGSTMAETILTGTKACQGCVISCGREVMITQGPFITRSKTKGPEYETICAFGSQLLVDDLAAITALGEQCDRLGMDTISAGNTLALAYLLFDQGIINEKDTGGLTLRWGDPNPCFPLLDQMARREGFGALLAQGSQAVAAFFGVPDLAVVVNGLEVPMHDPRAFSGQTLSYLVSPRGACHNQSDFFQVEMGGTLEEIGISMPERFQDEGKAALVARHQHWRTVCNSLVMCYFAVVSPSAICELLNAALGLDWDVEAMLLAGERGWNMKRLINLRLGLKPESEKLPRLLVQPLPEGGQQGYVPNVETLLNEYYVASGWDRVTGWPTEQKIRALGLEFVLRN